MDYLSTGAKQVAVVERQPFWRSGHEWRLDCITLLSLYVPIVIKINFLLMMPIHCQEIRLWEYIKWSPKGKCFDLLSNSLNTFSEEMYRDQFGEFVCGYWGLKGYYSLAFCSSKQVAFLKEQFFTCWYSNEPTFASDLLHHLKLLHQKENWIYPEKTHATN